MKVTYLGSSVSSTDTDINTRLAKAWTAIDRLLVIGKSNLTDKIKRSFFQAAVVSILLSGCTSWTPTKRMETKLDGNYTRMLRAILNKSGRQHLTKQQLYGHLLPTTKTIQVIRTRHAGHCCRNRDELVSDLLLSTPSHGRAKAEQPTRTYIQQLCADTGCSLEDLPGAMDNKYGWRERAKGDPRLQHNMMLQYRSEPDSLKNVEKQNNPNWINLLWCKANVKRFGFNNFHQHIDIMRIVDTVMDACRDNRRK